MSIIGRFCRALLAPDLSIHHGRLKHVVIVLYAAAGDALDKGPCCLLDEDHVAIAVRLENYGRHLLVLVDSERIRQRCPYILPTGAHTVTGALLCVRVSECVSK